MASLTEKQIATLKKRMHKRYMDLLEEIRDALLRSGEQSYIELAGRVADPGDESVTDLLAHVSAVIVDREIQELRDIEAALKRIVDESYALCIDCGGDIGYERLTAYPVAKRCFRCQAQHEKIFSHGPTPSL